MAIVAGIDEAGYGPTLGPLVVSGVAFRVPDEHISHCLWKTLQRSCTQTSTGHGQRLVIADSKKLFHGRLGIGALERAALVMLAVADRRPATWHALLDDVAPGLQHGLRSYPWYEASDHPLPLSASVGDIGLWTNAVRRDAEAQGVEFLGVFCEPLLEGQYNRLVRTTNNKAVVLMGLALRIAERIRQRAGEQRVRIHVDRLGGRQHYREPLSTSWPGYELKIVEESPERSAYQLVRASQVCEIDFVTGGEDRHLPTALASVYSKYVRELFMNAFNTYWCRQVAGLAPTAGYYTDAQRWLKEAAPQLDRLHIDRGLLVRER